MPPKVFTKDEIPHKIQELQEHLLECPDSEEYTEIRNTSAALIRELEKTKLIISELEERTLKARQLEDKLRRLKNARVFNRQSGEDVEKGETSDVEPTLNDGKSLNHPSCSSRRRDQQDVEIIFFGNSWRLTKEELDYEKELMKEITDSNLYKELFLEEETYQVEDEYGYWDTPLVIDGELVHVGGCKDISWDEEEISAAMSGLTITKPEVETVENSKSIENEHTSTKHEGAE